MTMVTSNQIDISSQFVRWALSVGRSEKTIKNYLGALKGPISQWLLAAGLADRSLVQVSSHAEFTVLSVEAQKLPLFIERNIKGKGMYSAALKLYGDFLCDTNGVTLSEDLESITQNPTYTTTERETLTSIRLGQGQFRQALIDRWGACAVTGYTDVRFLIASHIKPWRAANDAERLNPYNGLLLTPNLDKAFDLGYITFKESGRVSISPVLHQPEKLSICEGLVLRDAHASEEFLAYHRVEVFIN